MLMLDTIHKLLLDLASRKERHKKGDVRSDVGGESGLQH